MKIVVASRWLIIFPILIIGSGRSCIAQSQFFHFNSLNLSDRLPALENEWIYKDSRGFVWISTMRGLARFNGSKVRVYRHEAGDSTSLPDEIIQSGFFEDREGNLWFTTYTGLVCYVRKHDHFKRIHLPIEMGENGFHLAFRDPSKGFALVVDEKWLNFYQPESGTVAKFHPLQKCKRMFPLFNKHQQLTGSVGYDYNGAGVRYYQYSVGVLSGEKLLFTGKNPGEPLLHPQGLLAEGDSLLWIAAEEGLYQYNFQAETLSMLTGGEGSYLDVEHFKEQYLMASDADGQLKLFHKKYGRLHAYLFRTGNMVGLDQRQIRHLYLDRDGGLWLSIFGKGVDYCLPKKVKFEQATVNQGGLPDQNFIARVLTKDPDGNVWCITELGSFYSVSNASVQKRFPELKKQAVSGLSNDLFHFFIDRSGQRWVLAFSGLYMAPAGSLKFRKVDSGFYIDAIQLTDGRLLFSKEEKGLMTWNGKRIDMVNLSPPEQREQPDTLLSFTKLFQGRDGLLYATHNLKEIWVISPNNDHKVLKILPFRSDVLGFAQRHRSNEIWIGTSTGLSMLDPKTFGIKHLSEKDGLPTGSISAMKIDTLGRLWLNTNQGLVRYDWESRRSITFDQSDGLFTPASFPDVFLAVAPDVFWLGGHYGINAFNPYTTTEFARKPQTRIINLLINDVEQKPVCIIDSTTNISEVKAIRLSRHERTLSFDIAVLDFGNPKKDSFRYRMLNYDEGWVTAPVGERVRYPNMVAGNYIFQVIGVNSDGMESDTTRLEIVLDKKITEQFWPYALIALVVLGLGYAVMRYRFHQKLREAKLRNQIASDLHDDIGATLSNVRILGTLIRQQVDPESGVTPLLDRIEEEVVSSSDALDDIIWSINPQNDPLDRVLARLRRFASEVFEAKDIKGAILMPQNVQGLRLGMEKRRHFYLFAKEALHNMAKYANCTHAALEVEYKNGELFLKVSDNGTGFDVPEVSEKGNGLKTMYERAHALKGKMHIRSAVGKGTVVYLSFPITETGDQKYEH